VAGRRGARRLEGGPDARVLVALTRYHWPGNVRELQNVLAAMAVSAPPRGAVKPGLLPPIITGAPVASTTRLVEARDQFDRQFHRAGAGTRRRAPRPCRA
jgi:transcriptional regulator with PAS, ATPase and Fis domain